MIRIRRFLPAVLLAGLAAASLLFTYRPEPVTAPDRVSLSRDYYFHGAEMTLAGDDGKAELIITAGSATRALDSPALQLDEVFIRRGDSGAWSLMAESARLPHEGAEIMAQGNLHLTFGPSGEWAAGALHARIREDGSLVTLTENMEIQGPDLGTGRLTITGEHIELEPESMLARTDQPVRMRIGKIQFESNGLNARIDQQVFPLEPDARSTIKP